MVPLNEFFLLTRSCNLEKIRKACTILCNPFFAWEIQLPIQQIFFKNVSDESFGAFFVRVWQKSLLGWFFLWTILNDFKDMLLLDCKLKAKKMTQIRHMTRIDLPYSQPLECATKICYSVISSIAKPWPWFKLRFVTFLQFVVLYPLVLPSFLILCFRHLFELFPWLHRFFLGVQKLDRFPHPFFQAQAAT